MDPLAHTLVGLGLAKSGLDKRSGFAAAALVAGANIPDVDGVTYLVSGDLALFVRRGWTHGVAAMVVWPFILTAVLLLLDRALGFHKARFRALLPLSFLAVATHPALDWLNNYGMRWLMPFDGTWFYGDTLVVVDPWIWLTLGGAAFLVTSSTVWRIACWVLVGVITGLLVFNGPFDFQAGELIFVTGIAVFALIRIFEAPRTERGRLLLVRGALAVVAFYILAMLGISTAARHLTLEALDARGVRAESLMVYSTPMRPFIKDVVVKTSRGYRYGAFYFWPSATLVLADDIIPGLESSPVITQALARPEARGFANWTRFPWAEVIEDSGGQRVFLRDARWSRRQGDNGFGTSAVFLPKAGQ
jgi:inner membrane protein